MDGLKFGGWSMQELIKKVLERVGINPSDSSDLAALIASPPVGSFDPSELEPENEEKTLLHAAIVSAMTRRSDLDNPLGKIVKHLMARSARFSTYDRGRLWHLRGVMARHEESLYTATYALNRSVALLFEDGTAKGRAYLARVLDTYGVLLHQQGLLKESLSDFELALRYREEAGDEVSMAYTLGNIGRLSLDLGDFAAAARYFERDLEIVMRVAPSEGIRVQLLSHLAECALELGQIDEARVRFEESADLARSSENEFGLAFALIGLGKLALMRDGTEEARGFAAEAMKHVSLVPESVRDRDALIGWVHHLQGKIELDSGKVREAGESFRVALEHLDRVPGASPVERAALLRGCAQAAYADKEFDQSTSQLREALVCLDGTAADDLRTSIESELKEHSKDSWILHSAGRFVGQEQIELLLKYSGHGGYLAEDKEVAILFCDIRGFTHISEQLPPERLIVYLNDYLNHMTRCVRSCGGTVDKFIGDAVMAIFTLPKGRPDDAERAVMSALMMNTETDRFNRKLAEGVPELKIGVGVHFGNAVAGLIGSPQKRSYTIIGDAVNTASRLEGMTKFLGGSILITREVMERIADPSRFLLRPLGEYRPKGRDNSIFVYDLMGTNDGSQSSIDAQDEIEQMKESLNSFREGKFESAHAGFLDLQRQVKGTNREVGYEFLSDHARKRIETPPGDSWDGIVTLTSK